MSIFDSKKAKTLKGIIKEYERVFNLPVPDRDDGTLLALKHIQLEKLAFVFDELDGYEYSVKKGWNLKTEEYFIPNLTRYTPIVHYVGCNLGSDDLDHKVAERFYNANLSKISATLKKKRYKQLKDSKHFITVPPFRYAEEYLYPNPDIMRRTFIPCG